MPGGQSAAAARGQGTGRLSTRREIPQSTIGEGRQRAIDVQPVKGQRTSYAQGKLSASERMLWISLVWRPVVGRCVSNCRDQTFGNRPTDSEQSARSPAKRHQRLCSHL